MAHKVQAFAAYGPRLKPADPMSAEEFTERLILGTNQTRGSLQAVLFEMEAISEIALKEGRIVKLPNGMHLRPVMKRDGRIEIRVSVSRELTRRVNGGFRGEIINKGNIGKSEQEIDALWAANHPDDPLEE
jgi:hypothetical protein